MNLKKTPKQLLPLTSAMRTHNPEESDRLTWNVSFSVHYKPTLVYMCCLLWLENAAMNTLCSVRVWGWRRGPGGPDVAAAVLDTTAQRSLAENEILFFLFFSPGSHKHQRQTWVGSKCSLKKPTTLRNGRPNSSPWWRAKTKFGTRACIHFPGMGCLRQLPLSNNSVLNSIFL